VIFFPAKDQRSNGAVGPSLADPQVLDLEQPVLIGFRASSFVSDSSQSSSLDSKPACFPMSTGKELVPRHSLPSSVQGDYYQHPNLLETPGIEREKVFDPYSLGCLLLEIGLWENLGSRLFSNGMPSPYQTRDLIQNEARQLDG
jgi:hypothetical protein